MKNRKRILSLTLALAMTLTLLPGLSLAANGDFVIQDGVLTEYNGSGGNVVIPEGVTSVGDYVFRDCTGLTSVTIPNSVISIGEYAFENCESLTDVTIPDSVTSIGDWAFCDCTGLTGVVIPGNVTSIARCTFSGCTGLTSVTISSSVTSIEENAFYLCSGLTDVVIPGSVTSIGDCAFHDCYSLASVTIPESVVSIGDDAFDYCTALTDVYYGGTTAQWAAIKVGVNNGPLTGAVIHCNSSMPSQFTAPASNTAYASTQTVNVDGKAVTFECYALKEGNGMTNYIKLRDLAILLSGSPAQFQVGWDGSVTITTKTAYTSNGSELSTPYSGDRAYQETSAATKVNGQEVQLAAFVLQDDQGGGYTYYQLRDLGKALGFNVGWVADKGIFVETDKPYTANN